MLTTIIILSVLVAVLAIPYLYTLVKIIVRKGWTIREYIFIVKTLWLSIDRKEFLDLMELVKRKEHYFDDDEDEEVDYRA